jgi:(E)-4-hydroxy-3-methylbut-2-enyl-diphosphate synthase
MDENAQLSRRAAAGSDEGAIVRSAIESASWRRGYGMPRNRIILSAKCSNVQDLVDVYRELGRRGGDMHFTLV